MSLRWSRVVAIAIVATLAVAAPAVGHHESTVDHDARYHRDFPDPHVIYDEATRTYIAYSTNSGGSLVPMLASDGLDDWTRLADAYTPPSWAARVGLRAELWAPSVHQLASGEWRAYTTVRETTRWPQNRYCISVAAGPGPTGPFVDTSDTPLTCGYGAAGAIDPWVHIDAEGDPWLLWKTEDHKTVVIADDDRHFPLPAEMIEERARLREEGVAVPDRVVSAAPDAIWAQRLDESGFDFYQPDPDATAEGDEPEPPSWATILLTAQKTTWENEIVESPAMFEAGGRLHLLYSGNRYESHEYATGWATCDTPAGPCTRARTAPILRHGGPINGPGGASVFVDGLGDHRIAFHAWIAPHVSYEDGGRRLLHIEQLCVLPDNSLSVGVPVGWSFCDVDPATWFGPGIAWMAAEGITTGISEGRFAPDRTPTRAEAVTFLWRWAGSPAPTTFSSFTDVEPGRFYTLAAEWAAEAGIVRGTTPTTFSPDEPIDRAQLVTILHRAAGEPPATTPHGFVDVPPDSYFAAATAWAREAGVTTGLTWTRFGPREEATRAQFGTMLCRFSRLELDDDAWRGPTCPTPG